MPETPQLAVDVFEDRGRELPDVVEALRAQDFQGIAIAGPGQVSLDREPALPLIGFRLFDTHAGTPVQFSDCAIVTTVHLESGRICAARVEEARDDIPTAEPSLPPKRAQVAFQFDLDAAERAEDFPWRPGTLLTTILLADQASNRIRTRVSPGAMADTDPAVAEFLEANPRAALPEAIWPPLPKPDDEQSEFPRYREAGAPELLQGSGLAFRFDDRVVVGGPGRSCVLRGRFRLPVTHAQCVPTPSEAPAQWQGVGDEGVTAVAPVALLLTSNFEAGPFLLSLKLPSYTAVEERDGVLFASGEFAIDLFALRDAPQMPQTYFAWGIAGEELCGPATFSVVSDEMLGDG